MTFLAVMVVVVLLLVTAIIVLVGAASERGHAMMDYIPLLLPVGIGGVLVAIPFLLWGSRPGSGAWILALSIANVLTGAKGLAERIRNR